MTPAGPDDAGAAAGTPADTAPHVRAIAWEGFDALELSNGRISVVVVPQMGGHVASLRDVAADREWLWRNPRLTPRLAPYGAWFDDWWSGGWDEIFPGGEESRLRGEKLPYMGEAWCLPWSVTATSASPTEASLTVAVDGNIAAARFTRTFTLRRGEPVLRVHYRIESLDVQPMPFTWGIHPAFAVNADCRLDHTATRMVAAVSSDSSMGGVGQAYDWPWLPDLREGGAWNMQLVRDRMDRSLGGHWATNPTAGWLAVTDRTARRGIAYAFDRAVFPFAWLFMVYGGWRGHLLAAVEAWTSMPQDIEGAVAAGTARTLAPGEVLETDVAFILHEGLDAVTGVDRTGDGFLVR